ncbi:efflux RND transporter permease subunit [Crocinitomicaceae bacterium CZZ-1]|uniref:Efflux RND transporter permease subunit n=1 Tax=Taishania pollutisoli TaxID=2766479 RepID=A0A8J6PEI2_9FLAO|nr:efflux RND transporter permease subunit [Taishania pollutisoli]MBC9813123.1 efflux RND transporter permease subunit [Taishania pollutisoli]
MSIIKYPIKNYQFTLIIVVMIILVGVSTLTSMPRAEDPDMKAPSFPVVVVYPGTSPKDMEQLIVKPLEARFYGLDRIKRIKTKITNGLAFLFVEYEHGSEYDTKFQELIRELSAAQQEDLPEGIYSAQVLEIDPTGVNVIQAALISENASRATMKKISDDLKAELEKVKALKKVTIHGLPEQLIRVDVHPDRLSQMSIPLTQVMDAIGSEASNIPGGSIHAGQKSFSVKTSGNYQSIEQIQNTIVSSYQGKNVALKEVADVYPDFAPDNHITRLNGYRCLFITAAQKGGMNISETQKGYQKVLSEFKETLPDNVDLVVNFDQAENVNKRLSGLGVDFIIAIGLVLITLLPLGTRASMVVMIAIPLSLAIGIVILNVFGFSLNQLSIVGFVVALGLVVDDSIVVVENIERWMREGYSRRDAAIMGTKQIALAVVGCTATLIIAFMPLMFMPEMSGDFIRSMPSAVIGSVVASMFVALLVVPFLSSILLKPHAHPEGNIVLRTFQRIIHATYAVWLDKALKRPVVTVFIALGIFIGALAMIPVLGFSLFPESEKPQFMITISPPPQSNIFHSDSLARLIENDLNKYEQVKFYASNVGKGNPRIYYNLDQASEREDYAEIFVQLHDHVNAKEKLQLIDTLRKKWFSFLGAKVEVKNFEQGVPILSPVEVRLFGDNLDTLRNLAAHVETMLLNTKGTVYVNNPVANNKSDFKVNVNREKALALGVPTVSIDRTVRMALAGLDVATYSDPSTDDNDYKIRVSMPRNSYPDLSVFDEIFVNNVQGTAVPLSQLATIEMEASPSTINHINRTRVVYVNSFVQKGFTNDKVIDDVIGQMEQMKMPSGYHYEMGGEVESRQESFGGFGTIIVITMFLFIAVLILEFKTFKSTLIVLSVIPLGIVGAVVALWLTGNTLSFVATIGLVALAGIEVKNTILLVDFTNQLRREGMELNEAIEKAGELRFLPIILTTLTAIGGLLPIAWSSNPMISPLAIVMIGGLISSTLLSRIVTPVVYKLIPPKIEDTNE